MKDCIQIKFVMYVTDLVLILYQAGAKLAEVPPVLKQKSMVSLTLEVVQLKSSVITDPISQQGSIFRIYHNMITCR